MKIQKALFEQQDKAYRDFQSKLLPTVDPATVIGVRTPALRKLAKQMLAAGEYDTFLKELPHTYFDENQLHAFLISGIKDFDVCMAELLRFLPYIDNWATCDQLSPKVFQKHRKELLPYIKTWIRSEECYTIRFGVGMLLEHFLDEDFSASYLSQVAKIRSEEYYVNMMIAWYFATALAKQYDAALPFLEKKRMAIWTHNKTIQKAVESYRISPEKKDYLKTLRRKKEV